MQEEKQHTLDADLPLVLRRTSVPMARKDRQIPLLKAGALAGVVLLPIIDLFFRQWTTTRTWLEPQPSPSASTCSASPRISESTQATCWS